MKSVEIEVCPQIIDYVLNKVKNESLPSEDIELLHKWKTKEKIPRFTDIEKMSKKTHIDFGVFFLDEPPEESEILTEFRTKTNKSNQENLSIDLEETIKFMQEIQDWMSEFEEINNGEKLDFINSVNVSDGINHVAQFVRDLLKIPIEWNSKLKNKRLIINYLREKYAEIGILTMFNGIVKENTSRILEVDEFRAFALSDDFAPLIFINNNDSEAAKIFSLIYELIHLLLGFNDILLNNDFEEVNQNQDYKNIEYFCNEVTAELLTPQELFRKIWQQNSLEYLEKIKKCANYFNTSEYATLVRSYNLNWIDFNTYKNLKVKLSSTVINKKSKIDGNYWNSKLYRYDHRFLRSLINSVNSGFTQLTDAFRLTNTNAATFLKLQNGLK